MNRKIAYTWIVLLLGGYIANDSIENIIILAIIWSMILIIGCSVMIYLGWKQNKYLCLYWTVTLTLGTVLSAIQYQYKIFPLQYVSTMWMFIIGINFLVTTFFSKIIYFAPLGLMMIIAALPLDNLKLSYPSIMYGILISIALIGYICLSFLTPEDPMILGHEYNEANGFDEELLTEMHKFKCTNCGYIYEGHTKLNYCPRCMAGSDMLIDVD